eukprot:symbB.v1.2.026201.t1/scaffold2557.1/size76417/6
MAHRIRRLVQQGASQKVARIGNPVKRNTCATRRSSGMCLRRPNCARIGNRTNQELYPNHGEPRILRLGWQASDILMAAHAAAKEAVWSHHKPTRAADLVDAFGMIQMILDA